MPDNDRPPRRVAGSACVPDCSTWTAPAPVSAACRPIMRQHSIITILTGGVQHAMLVNHWLQLALHTNQAHESTTYTPASSQEQLQNLLRSVRRALVETKTRHTTD